MDRYLGTTRQGPMFLCRPEVANLVVAALQHGAAMGSYDLRAFVVMGNHVHALLRPIAAASRVLQWQRESYDHWVRDENALERITAYIENNPVRAGMAADASHYEWSSAGKSGELKFAAAR